jgi:hypothetical protein
VLGVTDGLVEGEALGNTDGAADGEVLGKVLGVAYRWIGRGQSAGNLFQMEPLRGSCWVLLLF